MLNANFTRLGSWELTYLQKFSSKQKLEPIELPFLTDCHIFLIGATSLKAKSTWYRAGWLHQEIDGVAVDDTAVFEGLGRVPTIAIDASQRAVPLNSMQLLIFPRLTSATRLRFEAVPWLRDLSLGIWEYRGSESDSTEDLIEVLRAKLESIEFKLER